MVLGLNGPGPWQIPNVLHLLLFHSAIDNGQLRLFGRGSLLWASTLPAGDSLGKRKGLGWGQEQAAAP